jgi:hypothetical protein
LPPKEISCPSYIIIVVSIYRISSFAEEEEEEGEH